MNQSQLKYIHIDLITLVSFIFISTSSQSFLHCLNKRQLPSSTTTFHNSQAFTTLLNSSLQNPRIDFLNPKHKPSLIITPTRASHVQSTVKCAIKHNVHIRVCSGGHDYEGLSYMSTSNFGPFVLVDLQYLRSIKVDKTTNTAWVESGANIGELYYRIAKKAGPTYAFPAGTCPSVGVGGHFSGGGLGLLTRAYGLASDNILDVKLVNANGTIVNKNSMSKGHFWAIRGGGGCSFGIVIAFKIKLVEVPPNVTVFTVTRTLEQGAKRLVAKWQHLASKLDHRLTIRVVLLAANDEKGNKTIRANFEALFLGPKVELLRVMKVDFQELELQARDCEEMSWIKSVLYISGHLSMGKNESVLLERGRDPYYQPFKAKSDFVEKPISEGGWERIWKQFYEEDEFLIVVLMEPQGGKMEEILESETPYPHRKGVLYMMQYLVKWEEGEDVRRTRRHLSWMKRFYEFMTPYVSKHPRVAYYNYRDLDLGTNIEGNFSYRESRAWGKKYFKGNFRRMAYVKFKVDPTNFFRNEQSVPPLFYSSQA